MAVQQAYVGEISLTFNYKEFQGSAVQSEFVEPERISYVMIEHLYDNEHILPVIYISLNLKSDMYSKIVNTPKTSTFTLTIRKKNKLIKSSASTEVVNDIFTYVTSSSEANYSAKLDSTSYGEAVSYKNITIGLVSAKATNKLRQSYNGIYRNIKESDLINMALDDLPGIIKEDYKYDKEYTSFLIPPLSSRFKLLEFLFDKDPFYDSLFTFYMDFKKSYLISRNGNGVNSKDGKPINININIKEFTAEEANTSGYSIINNGYVININANDAKILVNNSTNKTVNRLVAYSDENEVQTLDINTNNAESSDTKIEFVRTKNAASLKNKIQSSAVMIELFKQSIDGDIFAPNMSFNIRNYKDYRNYDGKYYLYYKKEVYSKVDGDQFTVVCNIGLKKTVSEEVARSSNNTYNILTPIRSSKTTSTNSLKNSLNSRIADR